MRTTVSLRGAVVLALLILAAYCSSRPLAAATIELPYIGPPLPPPLMTGLTSAATTAAATWEGNFGDPVLLHFAITSMPLAGGALGYFDADPVTSAFSYTDVKAALMADATSPLDFSAVGSLQPGPALYMLTQDTTSAPTLRHFYSSSSTFNSTLRLTRANQKALGLLAPADGGLGSDGVIVLNSTLLPVMDFDPGDGISPGMLDMTAILVHEMAHGMGFISGVDHMDFASSDGGAHVGPDFPHDYSDETIFTALDLYRYSLESIDFFMQPSAGTTLDWAAGSSAIFDNPFFSVDGGVTPLALFSTGSLFGDGFQAQHWKDDSFVGTPIGIMDPELDSAEVGVVSVLDVMALDAIGWNTAVPEPASILLASLGSLVAIAIIRRRRLAQTQWSERC